MQPGSVKHYGVKGMRWGVRRTPEQLARARGERLKKKKGGNNVNLAADTAKTASSDAKKAAAARDKAAKKGVAALSNDELKILNDRLNLEKNYTKLTTEPEEERKVSAGEKFARDVIGNVLKQQVTRVANDAVRRTIENAIRKKE